MKFDIIDVTEEETNELDVVQCKLLRTAQQKKNELEHKLNEEIAEVKRLAYSNRVNEGTIFDDVVSELRAEYEYQVEILREQLLFNLSTREPTVDDETGESGSDSSGYIVNYKLSYVERYIAVRDYYLAIEDPNERLNIYRQDRVAMDYLGSYYGSLFNYFVSFTTK